MNASPLQIRPLRNLVLVRMVPVPLVTEAGVHLSPERLYSREGIVVARGPAARKQIPIGRPCFIDGRAVARWEDAGRSLAIFEDEEIAGAIERERTHPEPRALLCGPCAGHLNRARPLAPDTCVATGRCDRCGRTSPVFALALVSPEEVAVIQ